MPPSEANLLLVVPIYFPGISIFSRQNKLAPHPTPNLGLFIRFGIKHTEDKTGPAHPARLAGEAAGENMEIGWMSGWPLASGPGAWFQDVSPLLSDIWRGFC